MKRLLIVVLVLLLAGCVTIVEPPDVTPTGEPEPSATATDVGTPEPTGSATPTLSSPTITMPPADTATASPTPVPTVLPAENLALCWGFECPWRYQANDASLKVPLAWTAFYGQVPARLDVAELQPRQCDGFKPAVELEGHRTHTVEAMFSARVIQAYRACAAGLYQTVEVKTGYTYLISAMLFNWSTDSPVVDSPSSSYIRSWVGVDPAGGTDYTAASVVWSNEESARDHFAYIDAKVKATGGKLTVFLLSVPNFAVARSDSFWDLVAVMEVGSPVLITPTPIAGSTPSPIIEVTPLGGFPDVGIGVIVYDLLTNVRDCGSLTVWTSPFNPTVSCPRVPTDEGAGEQFTPGDFANVWEWRLDQSGNRWAWFGRLTSVACYQGIAYGKFYPGVETSEYAQLKSSGALPAPVDPCLAK